MGCKVSVKVFGCSTDDYTNSVDFIEITLHSIVLKALAVLPGSAGLAIAVLDGGSQLLGVLLTALARVWCQ